MSVLYYIPFVYNDDVEPCGAADLLEARAECLEWFHDMHPEALITVGPLFRFVIDDAEKTHS